jgi:hypothetical protein
MFVANNIQPGFHDKRLASFERLKLKTILKRKNPYLFRAKAVMSAPEMVRQLLDAHLSSNEETLFGEFLESLAIFVCEQVYGGRKSTTEGIDIEFTRDDIRYAVAVKSGPNWGNSSQIARMKSSFDKAKRIAGHRAQITFVNGCCYGRDASPQKDGYLKLCGEDFWTLISNEPLLYQELVEPLGHQAGLHCDCFNETYGKILTRFTAEFTSEYCNPDGGIHWAKLLQENSGSVNQGIFKS